MSRNSKKHRSTDNPVAAAEGVSSRPSRYAGLVVCVLLLLAVFLVFRQTTNYDFVNLDDPDYVTKNTTVQEGLTWNGVHWAFTNFDAANWHPVTWLSHMLDCSLYRLYAGGHHLTSVLLHAAVAILLFLVLRQMTGDFWPSAFVAAVFAVHPLRVESVAWISERKDILSGLFFMLTLAAYVAYARRPFSIWRYLVVVAMFAFGLMAKPMLVTLPFVLLLLDYWPLGRMPRRSESPHEPTRCPDNCSTLSPTRWRGSCTASPQQESPPLQRFPRRLIAEKMPLLLLSAISCAVTSLAQTKAIVPVDVLPISVRVANAIVACVAYIGQFVFPVGLAAFYPHPGASLPVWKPVAALLVLLAVSATAVAGRRKCPYVFVGWFWYLGMLVPVIGVVQVGLHAMADRYTYLPQIGLAVALAWGAAQLTLDWPYRRLACGVVSVLILAALIGSAWRQTAFWSDSITLWNRALACTSKNTMAHHNLGVALDKINQHEAAIEQYQKALALQPNLSEARYNLGMAFDALDRIDEAILQYREVLKCNERLGKAHYLLGVDLSLCGKRDEALAEFHRTLELDFNDASACYNIGVIWKQKGNPAEALKWWRKAIRLQPNDIAILDEIAWTLAACPDASVRNGTEAVALAMRAIDLSDGNQPTLFATLAAAYAETERYAEAIVAAQKAIEIAEKNGDKVAVDTFRVQLKFYRAHTPYRERRDQPRQTGFPDPHVGRSIRPKISQNGPVGPLEFASHFTMHVMCSPHGTCGVPPRWLPHLLPGLPFQ
jgi:protein O-mannosyl-transferase